MGFGRRQVADAATPGLYSGFLISASQLGKILTAYHWGAWSDRNGRKRMIYVGLCGISLGSLVLCTHPPGGGLYIPMLHAL